MVGFPEIEFRTYADLQGDEAVIVVGRGGVVADAFTQVVKSQALLQIENDCQAERRFECIAKHHGVASLLGAKWSTQSHPRQRAGLMVGLVTFDFSLLNVLHGCLPSGDGVEKPRSHSRVPVLIVHLPVIEKAKSGLPR